MRTTATHVEFQQAVVEAATMLGWRHLHVRRTIGRGKKWVTATNIAGWPDLLMWRPARMIAAELKVGRDKPTPEQLEVLDSLAEAGVATYVWRPEHWPEIATVLNWRGASG